MAALVLALLAGCGRPSNSPGTPPTAAAKPDIIVTVDVEHNACVVAKYGEPTGSTIGCAEVVPFVRDELRVQDGSSYELRGPTADAPETNTVKAALDGAGFRYVGGPSAPGKP
jgi:type IV pilus biogenesis protein CpaD/CtpE